MYMLFWKCGKTWKKITPMKNLHEATAFVLESNYRLVKAVGSGKQAFWFDRNTNTWKE